MPIPDLQIDGILPPLRTEGRHVGGFSPYWCEIAELYEKFSGTPSRREIFKGFLNFRHRIRSVGVVGYQWLAGSFLEDIESLEDRAPKDIDVVTFIQNNWTSSQEAQFELDNPQLVDQDYVKATYLVDSQLIPTKAPPSELIKSVQYWYALLTHRRERTWKGILKIKLESYDGESALLNELGGIS